MAISMNSDVMFLMVQVFKSVDSELMNLYMIFFSIVYSELCKKGSDFSSTRYPMLHTVRCGA